MTEQKSPEFDPMDRIDLTDRIEIIERLRSAAAEHGEIVSLLEELADSIVIGTDGSASVRVTDYLKTAIEAAAFVRYDRAQK